MNRTPTNNSSPQLYKSEVTVPSASLANGRDLVDAKAQLLLNTADISLPDTRLLSPSETEDAFTELKRFTEQHELSLLRHIRQNVHPVENAFEILRRSSVFHERSGFNSPDHANSMRRQLQRAFDQKFPLILGMPLGGAKAPVIIKTGGQVLPDFSEFVQLSILAGSVRALRAALNVPVHFMLVPDAPLHAMDLGFPPEHAAAHIQQLNSDMPRLGISNGEVIIADTLSLLPPEWQDGIQNGLRDVLATLREDPAAREQQNRQMAALRFIKNPGMWGLNYKELILFYNALIGQHHDVPADLVAAATEFDAGLDRITSWYTAINHHGIRGMELIERAVTQKFDQAAVLLRCTVHAKPGEPRPQLLIANQHAPAALLPMHALALRYEKHGQTAFGLTFDLSARLMGAQRVVDARSRRFWYWQLSGASAGAAVAGKIIPFDAGSSAQQAA